MIGLEQWRASIEGCNYRALYRRYGSRRIVRKWPKLLLIVDDYRATVCYALYWVFVVLLAFMSAEGFSAALSLVFDDTCGYQRSLFALVQSPTSTVLQFSQDSLQRFWVSANPTVAPALRTCQVFLQRLCKLAASPSASSMMRLLVALHWLLIVAGDVELNPGPDLKAALDNHMPSVLEKINLQALIPYLISHGLLTEHERQLLQNDYLTEHQRKQELISIVQSKGSEGCRMFLAAVSEEPEHLGHRQIVAILTDPGSAAVAQPITDKSLFDLTQDPSTIRELLRHGANPENVYAQYSSHLPEHSPKQPPESAVKIFAVGDHGAGKSTLVKALEKEGSGYVYKSGWILQCSKAEHHFTPRFLYELLLQLVFSFALAPHIQEIKSDLLPVLRVCYGWIHGIYWVTQQGLAREITRKHPMSPTSIDSVDVTTLVQGITRQEEKRLLNAVDEVMKKKGTLVQTILQGVFIGPPRNGKSSLMKRLLNQELPSSSTDVVENITQVTFKKPAMSTANITSDSESDANSFTWSELSYDDEVVKLLKALSTSIGKPISSEIETVPAAEELPTSEVVHTLDAPKDEEVQDVGEIHGDIKHNSSHSLTPTPTITSAQEIPEIPETKFKTRQEVFMESLGNWSEAKKYFENACTMYLTDTGGQLEFQELLPALVSGPSVFFLVFRLDWDLNTEFEIYYSHSEKGQSKPYPSKIKLKDALLQSLASIAAMGTFVYEGQQMEMELQPKVFFVGTHKDKVSKERIKEIDIELQEAVRHTSFFRSGLIQPASDDPRSMRILLTVNNLSDDDDSGIKQVRKAVERIINQDDFKVRAPPQWLIFSLVLRQAIDQPVISYAQCHSLASNCGINDSEELDKALWFLSTRVGLIRYYRNASEDLRNLIILDPSIIFRKISKLVIETFIFENLRNPSVCTDFVEKGLFWLNDFVKITRKSEDELLTASRLTDLLQHLHIIARIQKVGENVKLFMPCILKSTKSTSYADSEVSEVPPLLVCFHCGYCPKGIFPALVAYLLNHNNETESEYPWILQEDEIYKNQVSFTVGLCNVSLRVTPTYIEVLCIPNDPTTCCEVCMSLKQGINQVVSDLHYAMDAKWYFGFVCQCCKGYHGAELRGKVGERKCHLLCPFAKKASKPPIGYAAWFTEAQGSTPLAVSTGPGGDHPQTAQTTYLGLKTPTLDELLDNVRTTEWFRLGLKLGVNEDDLDVIASDRKLDSSGALTDMLRKWLREHKNPTWRKVVEAMRKIGEVNKAGKLESIFCTLD